MGESLEAKREGRGITFEGKNYRLSLPPRKSAIDFFSKKPNYIATYTIYRRETETAPRFNLGLTGFNAAAKVGETSVSLKADSCGKAQLEFSSEEGSLIFEPSAKDPTKIYGQFHVFVGPKPALLHAADAVLNLMQDAITMKPEILRFFEQEKVQEELNKHDIQSLIRRVKPSQ